MQFRIIANVAAVGLGLTLAGCSKSVDNSTAATNISNEVVVQEDGNVLNGADDYGKPQANVSDNSATETTGNSVSNGI